MLTNLPIPRFIADSIFFDSDFLICFMVAMITGTMWVSMHLSSEVIVLLFQLCSYIPLWILELIAISIDLVLGEGVSKEFISVTRQYFFNQSVQMFLSPIRIIRYCCPLRYFPQVCRWIYIMHDAIDHEFVAGFMYHFLNIGSFFSGYLYIVEKKTTSKEKHQELCFSDILEFAVLFGGMTAMMAAIIQWKQLLQPIEEFLLGAPTMIFNVKFYIRNLKVQIQRILYVYTIHDRLNEARARRKAFEFNVHE